jgi:DNA-binding transcriptional ArsR family regulator
MSATGLAKSLEKNHSSIIHHLSLLKEAGLIEVTRTEKVRNMTQPFYRSISHRFHVSYTLSEVLSEDPDFSAWQETYYQKMLEGLRDYEIYLPAETEEVKEKLRICYLLEKRAYERILTQKINFKNYNKRADRSLAHILSNMQLLQDPEYIGAIKRLSEIIEFFGEEKS